MGFIVNNGFVSDSLHVMLFAFTERSLPQSMRGRDVIFFDSVISFIYRNVPLRGKWTRTDSLSSRAQMLQKSSTITPQKGVIAPPTGSDANMGTWDPTQQGTADWGYHI